MRISFNCEVASRAARNTVDNRAFARGDKGPAEGRKIEKFHDHIAKIRERINEIRGDRTLSSEAKADMIKELEENIHAVELEIEYLVQELKRKREEDDQGELNIGIKRERNRDTFEYVKGKNEKTSAAEAMGEFLDEKEAEFKEAEAEAAAAESAEDKKGDPIVFIGKDYVEPEEEPAEEEEEPAEEKKELPKFTLTGDIIPGVEQFSGDVGSIDKMKTVIYETRKLERGITQTERQYLKNGNSAGKEQISRARAQIRANRSSPLAGLLKGR